MKTGFALLIPASLVFAWSAPWACQTYTLPDGGTSNVNPDIDAGNGGRFATDAGAIAVYMSDSGMIGVAAADGGGVTVGSSADFASDFVYASNYADGTISRVLIQDDAGLPPYEQARYISIVPENNHCTPDNVTPSRTCVRMSYPWQGTCGDQLSSAGGANGANSPSRTIVDRKGNVVVALRAPGCQAGATRIINVGDHLNTCHIRCPNRNGLAPNQVFTEGVPLTTSSGSIITLLPSSPPAAIAATLTNPTVVPENVISAGTSVANTYSCPGHTSTDDTDPVNYDDCLDFSVALGDNNPDPDADPTGMSRHISFGRAAAISPNCNPASAECDTFIGMWNGAAWVHLSNGTNPPLKLFDVYAVDYLPTSPYGGSVDCAGILWGQGWSGLSGTTTIPLQVPGGLSDGGIATIPADTVFPNIPNGSSCNAYGISSDVNERVWLGSWGGGPYACGFLAGQLVKDIPLVLDAGWNNATVIADVASGWQSYNVGVGGYGRGINTDLNNNVFEGFTQGQLAVVSMNPDPDAGGFTPAPCWRTGGGTCVDKNGNAAPDGVLNWTTYGAASTYGYNTIGVDIDDEGNVWSGQQVGDSNGHGTATRMDGKTGAIIANVEVGSGLYSYSDFTGYALRHITLATANYSQTFPGCGVSPELTTWQTVGFTANLPTGTDLEFSVTVTNADDPTTLTNASPYPVCLSVQAGCGQGVAASGGSIALPSNLPPGKFLTVYATLVPKICSLGGGGLATAKPVLYTVTSTQGCAGD